MTDGDLFIFWLFFFFTTMAGAALFFIFALKTGMLKEQERARFLPLWAHVPEGEDENKEDTT
ncbi:MAG: hypothetical protein ABFD50_16115 [Smithella sp.]